MGSASSDTAMESQVKPGRLPDGQASQVRHGQVQVGSVRAGTKAGFSQLGVGSVSSRSKIAQECNNCDNVLCFA